MLAENSERGNRGKKSGYPERQNQAAGADENNQQAAESATDATARVHQDDDGGYVYRHLCQGLRRCGYPSTANRKSGDDGEHEVARNRCCEDSRVAVAEQPWFVPGKEQADKDDCKNDAKDVECTEHTPCQIGLVDGALQRGIDPERPGIC